MLAILAVGLPAYWLREPFRQEGAGFDRGKEYFDEKEVERGLQLFQASPGNPPTPREPHFGCETCHGAEGIGGVTSYTLTDPANPDAPPRQVQWAAPALNTVMLRFRPEEVKTIIVYGRAGTPMPAWGVEGGGPMNEQQVDDLIAYLNHIAVDEKKVRQENMEQFGTDGKKLFEGFCARCHTQGFAYGEPAVPGGGAFGPALAGGSTLRQFPSVEKHTEWVAETAEFGKQYGVRGIAKGVMPFFGKILSPEQIRAIVDYERTL
jgi:mono/diheme cytochrome c family protein